MQLGWRFPKHVYDLHTAYLSVSNILLPYNPDEKRIKQRKGLSYACCAYGIEGWEKIDKPEMAKAIGEGRWREYGQPAVFDYCEEDVRNSAELLRRQLAGYRTLCADRSAARDALERILAPRPSPEFRRRGMPIDMPLWNLVQENKAAVIGALIARFDPSQGSEYPIYSPEGEFSSWRFEQWLICRRHHVLAATGFRRAATRRRRVPDDVRRTPGDRGAACAARQSRRHCARPDPDRSRWSQSAEPVSVRHRDRAQRAGQEPVQRPRLDALVHEVSARQDRALSRLANPGSRRLPRRAVAMSNWRRTIWRGDIYHALAKMCGLTNQDAKSWKATPEGKSQRQRMKALQLGINYGMGVMSLSRGLGRHPLIGSEVIIRHQQRYPTFWALARRAWSSAPCWSA